MNPKCEAAGCALKPAFGFLGERPRRCKAHRLEGMVRALAQGTKGLDLHLLTCTCLCFRKIYCIQSVRPLAALSDLRSAFRESGCGGARRTCWRAWCACWLRAQITDLQLLICTVHVLGEPSESLVRGRWLRNAAFVRLSGRAAAAVQGAHAGGHGAHAGSGAQ